MSFTDDDECLETPHAFVVGEKLKSRIVVVFHVARHHADDQVDLSRYVSAVDHLRVDDIDAGPLPDWQKAALSAAD